LHNSLLHLLLKNCDIFQTPDISQGSVATRLGCGGVFKYDCYKFPTKSNTERILKIGYIFGEVMGNKSLVSCFFDSQCSRPTVHNVHR